MDCGVQQGSILGSLYVNDIAQCTESHILSFADDTTLFLSDSEPRLLLEKANIEDNKLFNWFCTNRLSQQKTKFIIIKPSKAKFEFNGLNLLTNGLSLERVGKEYREERTKFLGVIFDESLTWKHHINHINKKITFLAIKQVFCSYSAILLTVAYWHGEIQINLFLSILLYCKNEQLEPYVKHSITAILNHYLKNFRF